MDFRKEFIERVNDAVLACVEHMMSVDGKDRRGQVLVVCVRSPVELDLEGIAEEIELDKVEIAEGTYDVITDENGKTFSVREELPGIVYRVSGVVR